jgi:hypothetical protein
MCVDDGKEMTRLRVYGLLNASFCRTHTHTLKYVYTKIIIIMYAAIIVFVHIQRRIIYAVTMFWGNCPLVRSVTRCWRLQAFFPSVVEVLCIRSVTSNQIIPWRDDMMMFLIPSTLPHASWRVSRMTESSYSYSDQCIVHRRCGGRAECQ